MSQRLCETWTPLGACELFVEHHRGRLVRKRMPGMRGCIALAECSVIATIHFLPIKPAATLCQNSPRRN